MILLCYVMYTILESVFIEIMCYSNINKVKLSHIDVRSCICWYGRQREMHGVWCSDTFCLLQQHLLCTLSLLCLSFSPPLLESQATSSLLLLSFDSSFFTSLSLSLFLWMLRMGRSTLFPWDVLYTPDRLRQELFYRRYLYQFSRTLFFFLTPLSVSFSVCGFSLSIF